MLGRVGLLINCVRFSESQTDLRLSDAEESQSQFRSPTRRKSFVSSPDTVHIVLVKIMLHYRLRGSITPNDRERLTLSEFKLRGKDLKLLGDGHGGYNVIFHIVSDTTTLPQAVTSKYIAALNTNFHV